MALDYDAVTSITLQTIRKRLADNVFQANPTSAFFMQAGKVEVISGGIWIQEPLMYTANTTVMAYSGWDLLNNTAQDELTAAKFTWKQIAVSVSINGLEELQNNGPAAVLDLLTAKIKVAELSLNEFMDTKIHAAFTTKSAKDFLGLDELVEDLGTPSSTVGGINRTTYPWWQNKRKLSNGLAVLTQDMRNLYNTCSIGNTHPNYCVTTQAVYEEYENQNAGKQRISNSKMLDAGFENLMFKGTTMVFNVHCIAGNLYMLNTEFMRIVLHPSRNFKMTPFKDPINQDGRVSQILVAGNMTLNNSRFQGVMDTIV